MIPFPALPCPNVGAAVLYCLTILPPAREMELHRACQRFPPPSVANAWVDFGERHEAWICSHLASGFERHERDKWQAYLSSVRFWTAAWRSLSVMQNEDMWMVLRLEAMDDLRERIGERAWELGFIWPPVAAHWFLTR